MRTLTVLLVLAVFTALAFGQNRRGQGAGRPARGQGRGPRTRNPKLLCSIESTNDEELNLPPGRMPNGECPGNSTCSLGPISVSQFGQEVELTFCDAVGDDGNLLIFRTACKIVLADGTEIQRRRRPQCENCCTEGPLTGYQFNGQDAEAYFPQRRYGGRRRGNRQGRGQGQ